MHPLHESLLQSRRDFLATSANGVGLLALASLLQSEGRLSAAEDAREETALRAEGEELHLHLPRRRAVPDRPVRPQAEAQRAARPDAARVAHQERPVRLPPEGNGARPRQPAEVAEARPVRHGTVRPPAAPRHRRRRHVPDPLDAHRGVQPPPRPVADEHRQHDVRPAEHGHLADLRPRQRVEEPARLRRAERRPRHERRHVELGERLPAHARYAGRAVPQPGRAGAEPEQPRRAVGRAAGADRSRRCAT